MADVKAKDEAAMPINPKTMCPALMLAANRNDKVIGRTAMLTVSIMISAGLNHPGAPEGKRWAINILGENENEERIRDNHRGSPIEKVISKCLVGLNTYGTSPERLDRIRRINKGTTTVENPLVLIPRVRDDWENIISVGSDVIQKVRLGLIQKDG